MVMVVISSSPTVAEVAAEVAAEPERLRGLHLVVAEALVVTVLMALCRFLHWVLLYHSL